MPKKEEKIFRQEINFEIKETSVDDEFFYFEGYGSTADLDLTRDIVDPNAFRESLGKKMPVLLWQHKTNEPIGVFEKAEIQNKGLFVRGKMPLADSFVRERVVPQLKIKSVKALSIGFYVKEYEYDRENDIRTIRKLDLPEISLVTFPANPQAVVTGLKSFLSSIEDLEEPFNSFFSTPMAGMDCKWYEKEALERVGHAGYINPDRKEFPVLDEIAGTICIIPRAVIKARVELSKDSVCTEEKEIINSLYKRMNLDNPFEDGKPKPFCLTELKNVSKSVFVNIIRHHELSKDAADYVASAAMSNDLDTDPGDYGELNRSLDSLLEKLKS